MKNYTSNLDKLILEELNKLISEERNTYLGRFEDAVFDIMGEPRKDFKKYYVGDADKVGQFSDPVSYDIETQDQLDLAKAITYTAGAPALAVAGIPGAVVGAGELAVGYAQDDYVEKANAERKKRQEKIEKSLVKVGKLSDSAKKTKLKVNMADQKLAVKRMLVGKLQKKKEESAEAKAAYEKAYKEAYDAAIAKQKLTDLAQEFESSIQKRKEEIQGLAAESAAIADKIKKHFSKVKKQKKQSKKTKSKGKTQKRSAQRVTRRGRGPMFLRVARRGGYQKAFMDKYGGADINAFNQFYKDAKVPKYRQDYQFGKTHIYYWKRTFGRPKLNESKNLQQLNEIDLSDIGAGILTVGGLILFGRTPLGRTIFRNMFKSTSRNAKNVVNNAAKLQRNAGNPILNKATRRALTNETKAMDKNIKGMFDNIDDFITATKKGPISDTQLASIRNTIERRAIQSLNSTKSVASKTKDALRNPALSNAEKEILNDSLKALKSQEKSLKVLRQNAGNAKKVEDIVALTLGASRKYGGGFIKRAQLNKEYGRSLTRRAFDGALKFTVAGIGTTAGFLFKFSLGAYISINYVLPFLSKQLAEYFDAEEVIEFFQEVFGKQEWLATAVHYFSVLMSVETLEELPAALKGTITAEKFTNIMTDESKTEERVILMKSVLSTLALIKMSDFKKVPYQKALNDFNEYMLAVNKSYSGPQTGAYKELVKQNSLQALQEAATDIMSTKFPMAKFIAYVLTNQSESVPAGASAAEFLYERYFFSAVKQMYPGLEIDEGALFNSMDSRKAALENMFQHLKSVNAKPSIIKVFRKKIEKPTQNIITRSPALKNFIERKYFDGEQAQYVTSIKNNATRFAYKDIEKIIQNH